MNLARLENSSTTTRRDKVDIIAEILEVVHNGASKTRIMYKVNLSFAVVNKYLEFMLNSDFLRKISFTNKTIYRSTEKGASFFCKYNQIIQLLCEDVPIRSQIKTMPPYLLAR